MCDYSLEFYRSQPATTGEQYTLERFPSGSMGFVSGTRCDTAICMPEGAKLLIAGIAEPVQTALAVGAVEEVAMVRLTSGAHRDGLRFANGRQISLQALNRGLVAAVMSQPADAADVSSGGGQTSPVEELVDA